MNFKNKLIRIQKNPDKLYSSVDIDWQVTSILFWQNLY
jgi:hypothetical protein